MNLRRLALPVAAVALAGGGYLAGQYHAAPSAGAFGEQYCSYRISTDSFSGGSYSVLTAVVANWNSFAQRWESVGDYEARMAANGVECQHRF